MSVRFGVNLFPARPSPTRGGERVSCLWSLVCGLVSPYTSNMFTAVLLAAGRGRRLRPYTDHRPKPLLPVGDRPTLDFSLRAARRAGVTHVCLVTHYLETQIHQYVGDGSRWGMRALFAHQPEMLGTGHALQMAIRAHPDCFPAGQSFLLAATDYLLPEDYLAALVEAQREWGCDIAVSLKRVPAAELHSRSSVRYRGNFVLEEIVEKPPPGGAPSPYAASLIYLLPAAVKRYLTDLEPSAKGEIEVQSAVNMMLRDGFSGRGLLQPTPQEWRPGTNKID
ncbi:MAG: nucleotidyltransferase family protein [Ardenticatenaceae bacterium]|nr:nucleotidyltransferase family protein [Ardenticatenaceae bacterium]